MKIQVLLSSPIGAIAPLRIESVLSGISLSRFTSSITPKPLQCGHIPFGELKENIFGSGKGYEIPVLGHIKFRLKYLACFAFCSKIIKIPSP